MAGASGVGNLFVGPCGCNRVDDVLSWRSQDLKDTRM